MNRERFIVGWVVNQLGTDLLWNVCDGAWSERGTVYQVYADAIKKARELSPYYTSIFKPRKSLTKIFAFGIAVWPIFD